MSNLGECYDRKMSVRFSTKQYNFISTASDLMGIKPSDYLRMMVDSLMAKSDIKFNVTINSEMDGQMSVEDFSL